MADKFLSIGGSSGGDVTDGSLNINGATLSAVNLQTSLPLKTNSTKQLVSTYLSISDTTGLQAALDARDTLQELYDSSTQPQITTDNTNAALQIKAYIDSASAIEILDTSDTTTASINGNGQISGSQLVANSLSDQIVIYDLGDLGKRWNIDVDGGKFRINEHSVGDRLTIDKTTGLATFSDSVVCSNLDVLCDTTTSQRITAKNSGTSSENGDILLQTESSDDTAGQHLFRVSGAGNLWCEQVYANAGVQILSGSLETNAILPYGATNPDIGSSSKEYKDLYLSGDIKVGNRVDSVAGTNLVLGIGGTGYIFCRDLEGDIAFNSKDLSGIGSIFLAPPSGATQGASGAGVGEVWKTASHATLPDNVLMIGV